MRRLQCYSAEKYANEGIGRVTVKIQTGENRKMK